MISARQNSHNLVFISPSYEEKNSLSYSPLFLLASGLHRSETVVPFL